MTRKIVSIEPKPRTRAAGAGTSPERWIRGEAASAGKFAERLTIDIDEGLHQRLRVLAATEGRTMADVVRALPDEAYPDCGRWP